MPITPGQAHNIGKAGGKNHFNLGVGKTSGHIDITENALEAGYTLPSGSAGGAAFYTSADGTAVVFEVPLDGARTTSNTKYPRVEYRELNAGGSGDSDTVKAAWNGATGDHYVEHWFRVTALPPNRPEVVTHQIHGPSDDTAKIKWVGRGSTAKLVATYDDFDYATIATGLTLGTWYYAKLRAFNGDLEWYFGEGTTTPAARKDNATLVQVAGQYFKAGAYAQTYGGPAAGRSGGPYDEISDGPVIVEIRTGSLVCWHTGYPPPTGSTGAPTVSAGADATVTTGSMFVRLATESGSSITSRTWKIQSGPTGVGSTIDTDTSLAWTPTVAGSYVLRYSATNASGTGTDDVAVVVADGGSDGDEDAGQSVYPLEYPDKTPYPVIGSGTTTVTVASSSALTSALAAAVAGQKIVLSNGTYSGSFSLTSKVGTAANGISVEVATPGGAVFASGSTFTVKNCQHVTVKGLTFPYDTPGDVFAIKGASKWVRVTRCTFGPTTLGSPGTESGNFIYLGDEASFSSFFRIDHNEFRNKALKGNCVRVYGDFTAYKGCTYGRIDHNVFRTIRPAMGNDKEPIRYGVSTMSRTVANAVIERNYFTDCLCEPELTSVKMGRIRVSGNTYYRCAGGVVIRHGTESIQSDNYVVDGNNTSYVDPVNGNTIGSGGTRFYDAGHSILHNYYGSLTGAGNFQRALLLDTGDAEGSSTNLSAHWRIINAKVDRNVIVNCLTGIVVGDNYSTAPSGVELTNNITAGIGSGTPPITYAAGISLVASPAPSGNLNFATPAAGGFTQDGDGIWRKDGYGPRMSYIKQADVGPTGDLADTDGTGGGAGGDTDPTGPQVNAGGGATVLIGQTFARTATESGTGITDRRWTIEAGPAGSDTLLSTSASVAWTPLAVGSYVLRYAATNADGTSTDDITVLVTTGGGGNGTPPSFVGVGTGSSGQSAAMELAAPPGVQDRDFQIAAIISAGEESIVTVPAGWTLMDSALVYSPAGARGGPCIAWLFSTTDPVTGPATWTKSGTRRWHGVRAAWRGQSALGAHAVIAETTGSTSHPIPTVTPAGPNARVVAVVMADLLNATTGPFVAPTGWSERYDETKTSGTENESITIADVTT